MMMSCEDYAVRNDEQRRRLVDLGASLKTEEWGARLANGWSVAAVYGHLGFWDQVSLALIERYQRDGVVPVRSDYDLLNGVLAAVFDRMSPDQCYAWSVAAAEAVDARIKTLPSALAKEILEKDSPRRLHRYLHRSHHLAAVEKLLGRA